MVRCRRHPRIHPVGHGHRGGVAARVARISRRALAAATGARAMSGALHVTSTKAFLAALRYGNGSYHMPRLMLGVSTLLAVERGRVVSPEQLIDWLYGEDLEGGPALARDGVPVAVVSARTDA